jgi:outer membrane protein assembly factor BamD (BamD/ComL family)
VIVLLLCGYCCGDTLRLDKDNWQGVSSSPDADFIKAISELKQFATEGKVDQFNDAVLQMRADFPERTDDDFDSYIEGESLYANGKWVKAVKAYDAFLDKFPNSALYESAIERQLSVATAYLNGEKRVILKFIKLSAVEDAAAIIYKIVDDRLGDSPMSQRALVMLANSYTRDKAYLDARQTWSEINFRWSTGKIGRDSLLQLAYNSHSAYDGPNYDQTPLNSARTYYSQFKDMHAELADENQIDERISMVDEQLAYKQYTIGDYYSRTDHDEAAEIYYNYIVANWPQSAAAKMSSARLSGEKVTVIDTEKEKRRRFWDGYGFKLFEASDKFVDSWPNLESLLKKITGK